jgi:hypothetical protein
MPTKRFCDRLCQRRAKDARQDARGLEAERRQEKTNARLRRRSKDDPVYAARKTANRTAQRRRSQGERSQGDRLRAA